MKLPLSKLYGKWNASNTFNEKAGDLNEQQQTFSDILHPNIVVDKDSRLVRTMKTNVR